MRHASGALLTMLAACGGSTDGIDAGDITTGTLAVSRLPDDVVLEDEIDPTTDAGDLTQGTLAVARLPDEVVLEDELTDALSDVANLPPEVVVASELPTPKPSGVAGDQVTGFGSLVTIDSTTEQVMASVVIDGGADVDVAFQAHIYIEKAATDIGRFELAIRESTCSGTVVGYTFWRPPAAGSGSYSGGTLSLTGFAEDVPDGTTYVLCAAKFDGAAPNVVAGPRGLIATW